MRVLLANARQEVRSALRLLLAQEPEFQVAGEAADATGLLLAVERKQPDLLLLDWELPGLPADYLLRLLRQERPSMKIIALSSRPESRQAALQAGAGGFISKNEPPEKALAVIYSVWQGK